MTSNPNPVMIPDAIWSLWEGCEQLIPGVRLGGIYANKKCYHNSVEANKRNWPDAYCIKLPLDLQGDLKKSRAIDLTMSDAQMRIYTKRLQVSCLDPQDDRLNGLREFLGTLDGKTVYGLSHSSTTGSWTKITSDTSHLWHIHISFFTFYANNSDVMEGVLSVLSGQSYDDWKEYGMANATATEASAYNSSSILRGLCTPGETLVNQKNSDMTAAPKIDVAVALGRIADAVIAKLHADGWIVKGDGTTPVPTNLIVNLSGSFTGIAEPVTPSDDND